MTFSQQAINFVSNIVSGIASFVGNMLNRFNTDTIGHAFTSVTQTGADATAALYQTARSYIPSNGPNRQATADMGSEENSPVAQRRSTRSTRYQGSFKY